HARSEGPKHFRVLPEHRPAGNSGDEHPLPRQSLGEGTRHVVDDLEPQSLDGLRFLVQLLHTPLPVGKVPTESRGDEAPIIHSVYTPSAEAAVVRPRGQQSVGDMMRDQRVVMRSSSRGDAGGSPGQSISSSIHSFAVSRAAARASAEDAARFRNGTTIPLWLRGSCSGFQTSTLAENVVSTALSVMRIFQPRYTCSHLLALDSVMEDHLRRESTSAGGRVSVWLAAPSKIMV